MSKEEKFNCAKCGIEIGGHNKYLHDGMCDDCFFEGYFPEEAQVIETDIEKIKSHCKSKPIQRENQKFWDFLKSDELDQEEIASIKKDMESLQSLAKLEEANKGTHRFCLWQASL